MLVRAASANLARLPASAYFFILNNTAYKELLACRKTSAHEARKILILLKFLQLFLELTKQNAQDLELHA